MLNVKRSIFLAAREIDEILPETPSPRPDEILPQTPPCSRPENVIVVTQIFGGESVRISILANTD